MKKIIALSALLLSSNGALATVKYHIDLASPQHHTATVSMTLSGGHSESHVMMPAWRTGKYKILDLANGVRNFSVTNATGKTLDWQHNDKASWTINNPSQQPFTVTYSVYANDLGTRTRHIDDSHAFLDATGLFMYDPVHQQEDVSVTLNVPKHWRTYAGMERTGDHQFVAENYDVLVDSPIETGVSEVLNFSQDGKSYQLVIWGEGNYNAQQMASDLQKMVAASQTIWQGYPFEKYVFMVHATTASRGATEHLNSTIIQRKRFTFAPRKEYLSFLKTAAHEFVHTWNVKAYRPQGVAQYDYQQENYTDLLWISEGSTSYFQSQLLLQSGLMTQKEFFEDLAKRIDAHNKKPGKKVQSVAQSSHESWIAMPGDFANNNSVNIYSEGFMASLALDFQMLNDSNLKAGYRQLHGQLFKQHRLPTPFNAADVRNIAHSLTGKRYENWWQNNIDSPISLNFDKLLMTAGLEFSYPKKAKDIAATGFSSTERDGLVNLTRVIKGSPAWDAGLNVGDQIVAINGLKVMPSTLKVRLAQYKANESVVLSVFRRDRLVEKTLVLDQEKDKKPLIKPVEKPSKAQKAFFKAWLGVDFPKKKKK